MVKIKQSILAIVIGLTFVVGISYAYSAWTDPACGPTGCNVDAPINVGSSYQAKSGYLSLGTSASPTVSLNVAGASNFAGLAGFNNVATFSGGIKIPNDAATGRVLTATNNAGNSAWQSIVIDAGDVGSLSDSSGTKTKSITTSNEGVLIMTGTVKTNYSASTPSNAGAKVILRIDGVTCSTNLSFEAQSNTINFSAAATCIKVLSAGNHTLTIENDVHSGWLGTTREGILLQYVILRK